MELGPIQLVTVGFDAPRLDGSILAALEDASAAGHIRLIDAIGVYKDDDGTIVAAEATDLTEDEAIAYGAWIGALVGLGAGGVEGAEYGAISGAVGAAEKYEYGLDNEELDAIAAAIPAGGAAMLLAIEHTWAIPLRNAAAASGGVMLSSEFLSTTALIGLGVLLWVAGFDTIYSCQDAAFDRQHGLHSMPARWGTARALQLARLFHTLMLAVFIVLGVWIDATWLY